MKTQSISRALMVACIAISLGTTSTAQVAWDVKHLPASDMYEVTGLPNFPGGTSALMHYITENLEYPDDAKNRHLEGDVVVEFTIGKDGCITDSRILRGIGYGCDAEVLRLVDEMPCWSPAAIDGKSVACKYVLPVRFTQHPNL